MEYDFVCQTCDEELTFAGDRDLAEAECPNCGPVWVCPDELLQSVEDERRMDAARDDRVGR